MQPMKVCSLIGAGCDAVMSLSLLFFPDLEFSEEQSLCSDFPDLTLSRGIQNCL